MVFGYLGPLGPYGSPWGPIMWPHGVHMGPPWAPHGHPLGPTWGPMGPRALAPWGPGRAYGPQGLYTQTPDQPPQWRRYVILGCCL